MIAQLALRDAIARLRSTTIPDPARDARLLLAHAMNVPVDRLTLHLSDDIDGSTIELFQTLIDRRQQRQPVSHILGQRMFFGRHFKVSQDVLDPRPETETLVEEALKVAPNRVLDLGTGSGCLLLSILAERAKATGTGVDISRAALEIATENTIQLKLSDRASLKISDWFEDVSGVFDLIVSNPPYIDEAEWQQLEPEPKEWEPKIALTPGADGLVPYRTLAKGASAHLVQDGWLMVEIGWQQGKAVSAIFEESGWRSVSVVQDLGGKDRVVKGQKPAKSVA